MPGLPAHIKRDALPGAGPRISVSSLVAEQSNVVEATRRVALGVGGRFL